MRLIQCRLLLRVLSRLRLLRLLLSRLLSLWRRLRSRFLLFFFFLDLRDRERFLGLSSTTFSFAPLTLRLRLRSALTDAPCGLALRSPLILARSALIDIFFSLDFISAGGGGGFGPWTSSLSSFSFFWVELFFCISSGRFNRCQLEVSPNNVLFAILFFFLFGRINF